MVGQTARLALLIFSTCVSLGEKPSLTCSYVTDSKEWSLTGFCTVVTQYKMVWCEWRAKNKTENLIHGILTSAKINSTGEYLWNCSVKIPLPPPNGSYGCEVLLEEEGYNDTWRDAFSLRISDPGKPILKNCSEHVTEGENVTCECSSERDGEPHPVFSWHRHTDSSVIHLYEVRTNVTHTCEMRWGRARKTALYILTVSGSSDTPKTKGRGGRGGVNDDNDDNGDDDDDDDDDVNEVLVPIMAVVAVFVIIAVTTFIVIVIIRRKRAVVRRLPSNSRQSEVELIENSYYGGFQFNSGTEFKTAGNDHAEVRNMLEMREK